MNPVSCIITKRGQMTFKRITWDLIRRLHISPNTLSEIHIPNRVERSPTDILKALEKTISRDPTAAHYKFHDDPYLLPSSSMQSRSYALSRESGRKAAMWVRKEHADLFQHKVADPAIPSFFPPPIYADKSQVSEEILLSVITKGKVEDALQIYHLLQCNISTKAKQALLELLCFYNSQQNNEVSQDFLEEQWYRIYAKNNKNTWINNADITELFESLITEDTITAAAAYSTMICGLAKYLNKQKAWKLYEECMEKNIPLNVHAYNSLISLLPLLKEKTTLRDSVTQFFKLMNDNCVHPNIGTLNAALKVATFIQNSKMGKEFISSVISEFKRLNIQPSLASYCYILVVYYHQDQNNNLSGDTLTQILQDIKKQQLIAEDPKDTLFFPTAMEVASQILHDYDLGLKVHELLLSGDNYKFINGNYAENIYYKLYTTLRLKTEPLNEFMEFYDNIVPKIYIPEPEVISELLDTFHLNSADIVRNYLPKIWSHIVMFNFLDVQYLLEKIFNLMYKHCSPSLSESIHHKQFADAALTAWNYVQEKRARKMKTHLWPGETLGYMTVLLSRGDQLEEMLEIVSFMLKEEGSVLGTMQNEQINALLTKCILNGHAPGAIQILQYAANIGSDQLESMARNVYQALPLTTTQDSKLTAIVGSDIHKSEAVSNNDN